MKPPESNLISPQKKTIQILARAISFIYFFSFLFVVLTHSLVILSLHHLHDWATETGAESAVVVLCAEKTSTNQPLGVEKNKKKESKVSFFPLFFSFFLLTPL